MTKTTLSIFLAAVTLLLLAVVMDVPPFVTGGVGVLFMAGLVYAYVVSKRDAERAGAEKVEVAE
ncbi:hypothetical protein [Alteraurantiacibacter aquimixticola]|uniref:Uncharacterized protein n=1 Tax=Alteraurantiacibacter aquimixticola TaxID=2489173 RepID=A0A4T3EY34_9SPHN|nr:hypothetical protein [Alteraurantiacibacter aquimixticola]TIX49558.1 hypothetical protein E5222_12000 [Alteraurantiacibacter aquimixticola]